MDEVVFTGIEVWRATFPLRMTFTHNLATRNSVDTLIVSIHTAAGAVGYGQALPRTYLTGEDMDSAYEAIRGEWWPRLRRLRIAGANFDDALAVFAPLFASADAARRNASYAAVEMAALDAFSRERGIAAAPTTPAQGPLPLVGVVSAGRPGRAAWTARILRWLGYRRFKVKVGMDEEADRRRLAAVRSVMGGDDWLAVDANAAWTPDEAIDRMRGLRDFGVSLVEEPLASRYVPGFDFARLERETGIPVMADESLCTMADAEALAGPAGPSWWNVRFAKNGGFCGIGAIGALAKKAGKTLYGGILVGETSVLAAASRAAQPAAGAVCLEYGFPRVFLRGDPFRGGPGGFAGVMTPVKAGVRGLGVGLLEARLTSRGVRLLADRESP